MKIDVNFSIEHSTPLLGDDPPNGYIITKYGIVKLANVAVVGGVVTRYGMSYGGRWFSAGDRTEKPRTGRGYQIMATKFAKQVVGGGS